MALIMILSYGSKKMKNSNFGEIVLSQRHVITCNTFHLKPKSDLATSSLVRCEAIDIFTLFVYGERYTEYYMDVGGACYMSWRCDGN